MRKRQLELKLSRSPASQITVLSPRTVLGSPSRLTPRPAVTIVTPSTRDKTIRAGWTGPGERKAVSFEVQTRGVSGVEGTAQVLSTRGGKKEVGFTLGRPPDE